MSGGKREMQEEAKLSQIKQYLFLISFRRLFFPRKSAKLSVFDDAQSWRIIIQRKLFYI